MIVVDSSALVAIILREDDRDRFADALLNTPSGIGTPSLVETQIVLVRRRIIDATAILQRILAALNVQTLPFDAEMTGLAWSAFLAYGKGRHRAKLNFGDCMAYAVAKSHDAPLLYKGEDFTHTDIRSAL